MNCPRLAIAQAADALLAGGIIAYPTEGVFGLGCLPDDASAVIRILHLKQRTPAKGLILSAAESSQLDGWVSADDLQRLPAPDPEQTITWIAQAGPNSGPLLRGDHLGIAVRITSHPVAAAICRAVASPITSTSANLAGEAVAKDSNALLNSFESLVDYVVPGDCGPSTGASEIRRLEDGEVLRAGS